ncbi:hypothetical protein BC834DRAFT_909346 [Gloeopeniophorella convolvens]|nr:hypothetical protein BC834DRAFT_909346 [Gloeopeniophorella convolvens]
MSAPPPAVSHIGPQGSGKTFLTERVTHELANSHALRVVALSIDDLYLPHERLFAPTHNALLRGRGQPGTHDVPLGRAARRAQGDQHPTARRRAEPGGSGSELRVPRFDKSLHGGEGDRLPEAEWTRVRGPLDVVLLEGWCVGFYPQTRGSVALEDVLDVNERLAEYVLWWELFDCFVQVGPYVHIYKWRLEQEHAMKAKNGGKGMTDEQVESFIDRYIPGYHFFGMGIESGGHDPHTGSRLCPPWLPGEDEETTQTSKGKFLRITIDEDRQVVDIARH